MDDPQGKPGEIHFFGHKLPVEKERKFIIAAAAIGIIGVIITIVRSKRAAAAPVGSDGYPIDTPNSDPVDGGTGGGGGANDDDDDTPNPADLYQTVEFGFSFDRGIATELEKTENKGQSGSGGISFGPFSIGGGGGSKKQTSTHIKTEAANKFDVSTKVHGDAATITGIQNWLTNLAGSALQNQQWQLQAMQSANQYVGGTGLTPYVKPPPKSLYDLIRERATVGAK